MPPIVEVSKETLKRLDESRDYYKIIDEQKVFFNLRDDFIHVPSLNLYFAKERTHLGKNWAEAHKLIQDEGSRMPTLPQFVEFLKYIKDNNKDIYGEIMGSKGSQEGEWIDTQFEEVKFRSGIGNGHSYDKDGRLYSDKQEILDEKTLMEDKVISLEAWLNNPTSQGLPRKDVPEGSLPSRGTDEGSLVYLSPWSTSSYSAFVSDSGRFCLDCWIPCYEDLSGFMEKALMGVRAVRSE